MYHLVRSSMWEGTVLHQGDSRIWKTSNYSRSMSMTIWSVYLLVNERGRTYIGSTTNVQRRLRQHNGEIVGGARSTRGKGPWMISTYITGFPNRSSACRWERILKCRARGITARSIAFELVAEGTCPPHKSGRLYEIPPGLTLWPKAIVTMGYKELQ